MPDSPQQSTQEPFGTTIRGADGATRRAGLSVEEAVERLKSARKSAAAPTSEQQPQEASHPDVTNPEPEESDAGGSDEGAADAAAVEAQDEDGESKDPAFIVTVNGEDLEVPLSELVASYSRHGDYTQKTQALAEQRRAVEGKAKEVETSVAALTAEQQRVSKLAEQYDAALQALGGVLNDADKEFANVDWDRLEEDDPIEAAKLWRRYQAHKERKANLSEEQKRREDERKREAEERQKVAVKAFQQEMGKHFPQWSDEGVRSKDWGEMYKLARSLDFTDDEIRLTTDPRIFRLLHQAMQHDRIKTAKASATNQAPKPGREPAREPAKVIPPGGARPVVRAGSNAPRDAWSAFAKKPSIDNAAEFLRSQNRSAARR